MVAHTKQKCTQDTDKYKMESLKNPTLSICHHRIPEMSPTPPEPTRVTNGSVSVHTMRAKTGWNLQKLHPLLINHCI